MNTQIIRLPEVLELTGISRSSLYSYIAEGTFPAQIKLSVRSVGWLKSSVEDWIISRIEASKNTEAAL